jgi:aromatic ring-opening dioxygenase catalytic subunit (LigB family)
MEVNLQITVESKVEVGSPILMKDLMDIWTGQEISEQRRMEKRLDTWHVMGNMLKDKQDIEVVMVVINEWKQFIVRLIKLLRGNELLG